MPRKILWILIFLTIPLTGTASAGFYFEQEVRLTENGVPESPKKTVSEFKRKIYVSGGLFALQIEEAGELKKEFGFDFAKNLYYEADPAADYYKWFNLDRLDEAFRRTRPLEEPASARRGGRGAAPRLARTLLEGKTDYAVSVSKSFFRNKNLNGFRASLYKIAAGPGSSLLNPFGWYLKADVWTTRDVPGFSEYAGAVSKLKKKSAFYKLKHNRVSDFLVMIPEVEEFPLRVEMTARRRFGNTSANETTREITTLIREAKIDPADLLYFKESPRFSWHIIFSEGTDFGPDFRSPESQGPKPSETAPWLILPAFFMLSAFFWFSSGVSDEDEFSLKKFLAYRAYLLFGFLLMAQIGHYFWWQWPFLFSPLVESVVIFTVGGILVAAQTRVYLKQIKKRMADSGLKYCLHCRARIEVFYVNCPRCNRPVDDAL